MNSFRGIALGFAVAVVAGGSGAAAQSTVAAFPTSVNAQASAPDLQKLIDTVGSKLVTIKFILKVDMSGQMGDYGMDAEESEQETSGILIDSKGLVLTSNTQLGGYAEMFGADSGVSATQKDVKVLIGDDTEGVKAEVVARDKELDLAWVRITPAGDAQPKPFDALDVSKPATPKIGDRIYIVEKLGKYFDRAPIVLEDRVAGFTKKPRALVVPMGVLARSMGKPVFAADGALLGVIVVQMPDADEGGEGPGDGDVRALGMILPASEISKATERALATAAASAGKPAADTKPADTKPAAPAPPASPK